MVMFNPKKTGGWSQSFAFMQMLAISITLQPRPHDLPVLRIYARRPIDMTEARKRWLDDLVYKDPRTRLWNNQICHKPDNTMNYNWDGIRKRFSQRKRSLMKKVEDLET
jgi:hypothetical protein